MEPIITATYTAAYKRVVINFMANDEHEIASCGEVSDDEIMALVTAEGADVEGWECRLH